MKIYWTYFVHLKINLSAFEKTQKRALRLVIYLFANMIVKHQTLNSSNTSV